MDGEEDSDFQFFSLSDEDSVVFEFLPGTVNKRQVQAINYSSDSDNYPISEVAAPHFKEKKIDLIKYVDDQTSIEKLDMSNAIRMTVNGRKLEVKRAVKSENIFRRIETNVLCISAATSYEAEAYIQDVNGTRIDSSDSMKALGFHFSRRLNASLHIEKLKEKIRRQIWSLRHLRKQGFNQANFLRVYTAMIRSVAEYCQVVYHTLITEEESKSLDRLECQCLNNIYGNRLSYKKMLKKAGFERLSERRARAFDAFAVNAANSAAFRH